MPMWSDLPDQADIDDRRAARAERRSRSRRTRLQRLSVTVTTLSLVAVGAVVVVARPAADVAPVTAPVTVTAPAPATSATPEEVDAKLREALATSGDEAPPVTPEAPAPQPQAVPVEEEADAPDTAEAVEESSALPAEALPVATEGDYGAVIEIAQRALDVEPTGYFGPKTKAAVAEYQQAVGLPATGQIATFTWSALGAPTVEAALEAIEGPEGYVEGEPAPIQETPAAQPAPRSAAPSEPPVLEETDSGESVAVVQRALGVKPASGYFGPITSKAVKAYQANNGIPTTGVIATLTWGALGQEVANKAATAHATYGTVFGPGAPSSNSGSSSSGSSSSGSSSSGSGNSGSGNSGSSGGAGGNGNLFCPVKNFYYGDGLGAPRPGGRSHAGLDLMGKRGEPIYAIDSGKVTRSGYQSNGSLILDITGPRGMYFYGHFDKILVGYGQSVKAGQLIGYMGDTGSPGAVHLHLEVRPNGWSGGYSDPVPLIKSLCGR